MTFGFTVDLTVERGKRDVDDLGFVDAMLDELEQRFCIDADRVYSTGYSNGAFFSYRLACERSDPPHLGRIPARTRPRFTALPDPVRYPPAP